MFENKNYKPLSASELSMGWVDPWVGLGRDFSIFGGLGWVHYSKSTKKFERTTLMHLKARLDKI